MANALVPFQQIAVTEEPTTEGAPYGTLKQTHDEYNPRLLETIEDLYVGGFQIQEKADKYLVRLEGENEARYRERCKMFSYLAFFSQIVDQFTSDVFGQPLSVKPAADADNPNTPGENPDEDFYNAFEKNADRKGTGFVDLMMETLRTALKHRHALVIVDAPKDPAGAPPANRSEEDARGVREFYAYACPLERLIDWEVDEDVPADDPATAKHFKWAKLYDKEPVRTGPLGRRDMVRECFTVWTMSDPKAGPPTAQWSRYEITYKRSEPPKPETWVRKVEEGKTSFDRIPILRFELPFGLWVGNKVGPQALEHWNRRTALGGAQNRSLAVIPFVKKGPQAPAVGGAIPADIAQDQSRGNRPMYRFNGQGWLELAEGDEFGYGEPEGKAYALIDGQLEKLREVMFQVTFQMAASVQRNNTSMGRSGVSKQKDEDLTSRVLRGMGHCVRMFGVSVVETISVARGEEVHWTAHGLDGYDSEDRQALIEEALTLDQVAEAIPSPTFHKVHARAIAGKLLKNSVDVETMGTIVEELEQGIEEKRAAKALIEEAKNDETLATSKAKADAAKNGQPPLGVQVPGVKVPQPPKGGAPKDDKPKAKGGDDK